jgi:hypothetical protein
MEKRTHSGGIKILGSTRVAAIEIGSNRCAAMCIEAEGGHFETLF